MDDNVWEYPFGDLDEDDDMFYRKPERKPARQKVKPEVERE